MKELLQPDTIFHIYNHANGAENLFKEKKNYPFFLSKYHHYIDAIADTFAYCLMPNHFHLMLRVRDEPTLSEFFNKQKSQKSEVSENLGLLLSRQFSRLFNSYTKAFNKTYNRKGSLFMSNFKRKAVDSDYYITALISYIHQNPVHHGFIKDPFTWPYSSINSFDASNLSRIQKEVIDWFGSYSEYVKFHEQPVDLERLKTLNLE